VPGTQTCVGASITTCSASGAWGAAWPCASGACSDGVCTQPASADAMSCAGGGPGAGLGCGPDGNTDCCASLEVPGGTFGRDGDACYPATIGNFRLDAYEVTAGRFRPFVEAWVNGWRPKQGSGLHAHLNGGNGLENSGDGGDSSRGGMLPGTASSRRASKHGRRTCSPVRKASRGAPRRRRPTICR
jgi:hypothetical protein